MQCFIEELISVPEAIETAESVTSATSDLRLPSLSKNTAITA